MLDWAIIEMAHVSLWFLFILAYTRIYDTNSSSKMLPHSTSDYRMCMNWITRTKWNSWNSLLIYCWNGLSNRNSMQIFSLCNDETRGMEKGKEFNWKRHQLKWTLTAMHGESNILIFLTPVCNWTWRELNKLERALKYWFPLIALLCVTHVRI